MLIGNHFNVNSAFSFKETSETKVKKGMNNYGITTQRATSLFSVSKISFIYLMAPTDFTNEQNTLCRVSLGYSYTLKMKINISVCKIWWVEACIY